MNYTPKKQITFQYIHASNDNCNHNNRYRDFSEDPTARQLSLNDTQHSSNSRETKDFSYCSDSDSSGSCDVSPSWHDPRCYAPKEQNPYFHAYKKPVMPHRSCYVAMDCEMVATPSGRALARVVIIDWKNRVLLDCFVKPTETVTDYLTFVSGITATQLEDAPDFHSVRRRVRHILHDKILVGHGLENDLAVLDLTHPWWMIRDTAYYQPFMRPVTGAEGAVWVPRKLKELSQEKLKKEIQRHGAAHCPMEDARAALDLYKSHRPRWESCLTAEIQQQRRMMFQQQLTANQHRRAISSQHVMVAMS